MPCKFFPTVWSIWNSRVDHLNIFLRSTLRCFAGLFKTLWKVTLWQSWEWNSSEKLKIPCPQGTIDKWYWNWFYIQLLPLCIFAGFLLFCDLYLLKYVLLASRLLTVFKYTHFSNMTIFGSQKIDAIESSFKAPFITLHCNYLKVLGQGEIPYKVESQGLLLPAEVSLVGIERAYWK